MPSRKSGESEEQYSARNARYYRNRIEKAKREGRSLQSGRGRHPREKEARTYRPGKVARQVFGPPRPTHRTFRTYRSRGAENAFGYVFPFTTERDHRRVERFIEGLPPSSRDGWTYRFGGRMRDYRGTQGSEYVTTEHFQLYDVARFNARLLQVAPKFVQIVAVHFDFAK